MTERRRPFSILIIASPFLLLLLSLYFGPWHIPPLDVFKALLSPVFPSLKEGLPEGYLAAVFSIRLPRLILAFVAGAALSVSGASLQALFKNPLVNEYILGTSSGAAFGAALSLVFFGKACSAANLGLRLRHPRRDDRPLFRQEIGISDRHPPPHGCDRLGLLLRPSCADRIFRQPLRPSRLILLAHGQPLETGLERPRRFLSR